MMVLLILFGIVDVAFIVWLKRAMAVDEERETRAMHREFPR